MSNGLFAAVEASKAAAFAREILRNLSAKQIQMVEENTRSGAELNPTHSKERPAIEKLLGIKSRIHTQFASGLSDIDAIRIGNISMRFATAHLLSAIQVAQLKRRHKK